MTVWISVFWKMYMNMPKRWLERIVKWWFMSSKFWDSPSMYILLSIKTQLINNKPVLNVLSKENMDSLLGDEGAFRDWPLKSWGLLSRGSDPLVLILRDIFKIVIQSQQKYTQANMSIQFTYYLSMQYLNCLDKALSRCCMYYLELAIWSECIIINLFTNFYINIF